MKRTGIVHHFAAIDIGSNAVRLLIKGIAPGETPADLTKISIFRVPLRLGQDAFTDGKISVHKAAHLVELMQAFSHLMAVYHVISFRACATAAMRDAANSGEIVARIREKTGISVDIISGFEEARMVYDTHAANIFERKGNFIYADVGGGSTEITLICDGMLQSTASYNIGTVRMLNACVEAEESMRMKMEMRQLAAQYPGLSIIGSGGNINKLFRLSALPKGVPMSVRNLRMLYDSLRLIAVSERVARYQLDPDRADVIVPAADIFLELASLTGARNIWVPNISIADGIAYDLCAAYLSERREAEEF